MKIGDQIHEKLSKAFHPSRLEVVDDSESHRGHAGWREGGQTHFNVLIRAVDFEGASRIQKHRAVHKALGADLVASIHALSLDVDAS